MRLLLLAALLAAAGVVGQDYQLAAVTPAATHGEGPHWDAENQVLYYVDIAGNYVNKYDPSTGDNRKVLMDTNVTLVVPVADCPNRFVVGLGRSLSLLTWDGITTASDDVTAITEVEGDDPEKSMNRFNDGKADANGRLWAGTMGEEVSVGNVTPDMGTLYKLEVDATTADVVLQPVSISNGIAWNADNTIMYYIDSQTYQVQSYSFDIETGTLAFQAVVYQLAEDGSEGMPDGMTIDSEGNLWVAVFNGGKVIQVSPDGALLNTIPMPADRVTSVAWGGANLDELYVTTSRMDMTDDELLEHPLSGCVIRVTGLGVVGTLANNVQRTCPETTNQ